MNLFITNAPANGNALKSWRVAQGWTQVQAAAWYGVHERTWRRYENMNDGLVPTKLNKRIYDYTIRITLENKSTGEAS